MQQRKEIPRRTIAFVAFGSAEPLVTPPFTEGSATFIAAPPAELPSSRVVTMIDLAMLGTYPDKGKVDARGTLESTPAASRLTGLAEARPALRVAQGRPGVRGSGDFFPFCKQGVPFVQFSTPDSECHQKPCDKPERLDYLNMAEITRLGADLTLALADTTTDLAGWRAEAKPEQLGCTGG